MNFKRTASQFGFLQTHYRVILTDMIPEQQPAPPDWVTQLQTRGLGDALGLALDVLEPLGVLGAQLIWVAQPVLGIWFNRNTVQSIAQTLETPGEVEYIRRFLEHQD